MCVCVCMYIYIYRHRQAYIYVMWCIYWLSFWPPLHSSRKKRPGHRPAKPVPLSCGRQQWGYPKNGRFMKGKSQTKIDDLGVPWGTPIPGNLHMYVYIYIYGAGRRAATPPQWYGPLDDAPAPPFCMQFAAFLMSSLVFARYLQHFFHPATYFPGNFAAFLTSSVSYATL